jgi:hypothetical protein
MSSRIEIRPQADKVIIVRMGRQDGVKAHTGAASRFGTGEVPKKAFNAEIAKALDRGAVPLQDCPDDARNLQPLLRRHPYKLESDRRLELWRTIATA